MRLPGDVYLGRIEWLARNAMKYPAAFLRLPKGTDAVGLAIESQRLKRMSKEAEIAVEVNGLKLLLDRGDGQVSGTIYDFGEWEPSVSRAFKAAVKGAETVIDVGANIGWFTILAASVGARRIYAFEPCHSNASLLRRSIELNDIKNVRVEEMALGERPAVINLCSRPGSSNTAPKEIMGWEATEVFEAACTTLDSFVAKEGIRSIDVAKIDAEWAEPRILTGAGALLPNAMPEIFMEYTPSAWTDWGNLARFIEEAYRITVPCTHDSEVRVANLSELKRQTNLHLEQRR